MANRKRLWHVGTSRFSGTCQVGKCEIQKSRDTLSSMFHCHVGPLTRHHNHQLNTLLPLQVCRMSARCGKGKKRRRSDKEGISKSDNDDKGNAKDLSPMGCFTKEGSDGQERGGSVGHTMDGKMRKVGKNVGKIKIITWNVAGLRAWIKKNGCTALVKENPDIVALQETKCLEVPNELKDGYHSFLNASERSGQGGVLLLTKEEPLKVACTFDDNSGVDGNGKGRIIVAEYDSYYLINAYVPNSGRGLVNLGKRKVWDDYYFSFIKKLDSKKPVVYVGDLNVAHQEIDLANPKSNHNKTAGFTDQERNDFTRLLDAGFVDVFRRLNPEKEGAYTFWSNMHNAREKNVGWRLDYFVVSERIMNKVKECDILSSIKGSDHCPLSLTIEL
uniref:DNA-(apurinic or apyrimidinic site) endonuclease n=1 Tax=Setaria digitata TaxID=48799 RepID=A0A915Q4I3_9BILA